VRINILQKVSDFHNSYHLAQHHRQIRESSFSHAVSLNFASRTFFCEICRDVLSDQDYPALLALQLQWQESCAQLEERPEAGLVGLVNLGNTCFMNSVLQGLSHTAAFRRFILDAGSFLPHSGLHRELSDLLFQLWCTPGRTIRPVHFVRLLYKLNPSFKENEQQVWVLQTDTSKDAHECLQWILDTIHEQTKQLRVTGPPKSAAPAPLLPGGIPRPGPIATSFISEVCSF
jgi:hypothetical protein